MTDNLRGLIERLEKLEGPDSDVNADLLEATGGCAHRETEYYCIEDGNDTDSGFTCKRCGKDTYGQRVPAYTASLDTAVALLGRLLPGKSVLLGWGQTEQTVPWARVGPWSGPDATGATLAIALLIATLKALSQEPSNG